MVGCGPSWTFTRCASTVACVPQVGKVLLQSLVELVYIAIMSVLSILVAAFCMSQTFEPSPGMTEIPVAPIGEGMLVGRLSGGVESFRGVAYAQSPTGSLRWRPPEPAEGWVGPRDAGHVGPICVQRPANGDPGVGPLPMSEDCLTLNLWVPQSRQEPLPVLVWIHGGGYNNGSGTAALYDGSSLARHGSVVVTLNYRLGRLGFFDHPALAADRDDTEPAGNYGVMDMIEALRWLQRHVAAFGGDAQRITIFGESAGGLAVGQLMVAPAARGLFASAVIQSGLGRQKAADLASADPAYASTQARGAAWVAGQGIEPSASALRDLPAERLLHPEPDFFGADLILNDGPVVPMDVEAAFAQGLQAPVPLIIGTNSAEFWWMKPSDPTAYGALDDGFSGQQRDDLVEAYGGLPELDAHLISDMVFNEPARHLARLHAAAGHPTWLYRFDVVSVAMPEPHIGATHASERPYVFDNLQHSSWPTDDMDQRAASLMAGYWTAFAQSGDPNGDERPAWPDFRVMPDHLLEFGNEGAFAKPVPFGHRLDLIEAFHEPGRSGD